MPRVNKAVASRARRKKTLARTRGYRNASSRSIRAAKQALLRAGNYAYRDRRRRKREFRALWIARINAGARAHGLSYSRLMNGLTRAEVEIDRRALASLAMNEKDDFAALVEVARSALN